MRKQWIPGHSFFSHVAWVRGYCKIFQAMMVIISLVAVYGDNYRHTPVRAWILLNCVVVHKKSEIRGFLLVATTPREANRQIDKLAFWEGDILFDSKTLLVSHSSLWLVGKKQKEAKAISLQLELIVSLAKFLWFGILATVTS